MFTRNCCTTGYGPAGTGASPSLRVLVVEDEPVNASLAEAVLLGLACEVTIAYDGAAAVEQALREPFDVILMDVSMPVMDGLESAHRIASAERSLGRRRTPVVAVTGRAMPFELQRCFDAGMDDVLVKPYCITDLQDAVMRWGSRVEVAGQ